MLLLPEPLLVILGASSLVNVSADFTLSSIALEMSARGVLIKGPLSSPPALFTSTST
jgi:uncharacterized protein (DUF4213/DUF364 family)